MTQITNIRNERINITTDPMDIKRIIKEHYQQLSFTQLINQMNWVNSSKDTVCKNSHNSVLKLVGGGREKGI